MSIRPILTWLSRVTTSVVVAGSLLLSTPSLGQQNEITPEVRRAIDAAASALDSHTAQFENLLSNFGFPPADLATEWRGIADWPIDRQLEAAWRAAEQAKSGSGEEFLRAYARQVASLNDAIRHEGALKDIFPEPLDAAFRPEPIRSFQFERPVGRLATDPLPSRIKAILPTIAAHSTGYPGGPFALVRQCCNLNEARALEKILSANNIEEVLEYALRNGEYPPELRARLAKLLDITVRQNAALAYAESMAPFRDALERIALRPTWTVRNRVADLPASFVNVNVASPTDTKPTLLAAIDKELGSLSEMRAQRPEGGRSVFKTWRDNFDNGDAWPGPEQPPGGGGGGGGGGKEASFGDVRERAFDFGNYGRGVKGASPGGGGHGFTTMRGFFGGKGGVIFGSEVTGVEGLPVPVSVTWTPLDGPPLPVAAETVGTFLVLFSDGTVSATPPLVAEDALAAVRLVFTGIPGAADAVVKGEGIGLAGAGTEVKRYSVESGSVVPEPDIFGGSFYVHPAISDLGLGPVTMVTDGFPFIPLLMERLDSVGTSADNQSLAQELSRFLYSFEKGRYKIIDVQMEVYRPDPLVIGARRTGDGSVAFSDAHLESYFLDMQTFDRDIPHRPTPDDPSFYRLMPLLVELSSDYARLNDFARSLGILRWASENGALWTGSLDLVPSDKTFGTMFIDENGKLVFGPDYYELLFDLATKVNETGKSMLAGAGADQGLLELDDSVSTYEQQLVALFAIGDLHMTVGPGFYDDQYAPLATDQSEELADLPSSMIIDGEVFDQRVLELGENPLDISENVLSDLLPTEAVQRRADLNVELETATNSRREVEVRLLTLDMLGSASVGDRLYARWALAPESARNTAKIDLDDWLALLNGDVDGTDPVIQELEAVLPNPTPSEIDDMRAAMTTELDEISGRIGEIEQAISETSPRGFEEWYRLHISFYDALWSLQQ